MRTRISGRIALVFHRCICALTLAAALVPGAATPAASAQGSTATASTLTSSNVPGTGFLLNCDVMGALTPGKSGPTGSVTFTDLTENLDIGSDTLGHPRLAFGTPVSTSLTAKGLVAAGDFNNDGKDDLAYAETSTDNVDILIGNGDGTFEPPVLINVGSFSKDIVAGRFTSSGNVDLAVATVDGLVVLLGDGSGGFTSNFYKVIATPSQVVAADFNQDGKLDIAVFSGVNFNPSITISVFLGDGGGTFKVLPAAPFSGNYYYSQSRGATAAILTKSGFPDFVFATGAVLLGNGDGTFYNGQTLPALPAPVDGTYSIATADLNGDGEQDVVITVSNDSFSGRPTGIAVYLGNGDGTFQNPVAYSSSHAFPQESLMVTGDFRGVGKIDIIATGIDGPVLYPANGDGTFGQATSLNVSNPVDSSVAGLATGNFSGTGAPGLANAGPPGLNVWPQWPISGVESGSLQDILFNSLPNQPHLVQCSYSGDTDYGPSISSSVSLSYVQATAPTISPHSGTYRGTISAILIAPSPGTQIHYTTDGSTPTSSSTLYTGPIPVGSNETINALASGTGWADSNLSTASYTITASQPQIPQPDITPVSGVYSSAQTVTITDSQSGVTIHYTTDGSVPTASSPSYSGPFTVSASTVVKAVAVASGYTNSPPAWSAYTLAPVQSTTTLTITGFNPYTMNCSASGRAVAGVSGPTGSVAFTDLTTGRTLATGTLGTATQTRTFASFGPYGPESFSSPKVVGDFNGDGIPDVVFLRTNLSPYAVSETLLGNGDGSYQTGIILSGFDLVPIATVAADFNGDGKLDVATLNSLNTGSDYAVIVHLGNGDGTFKIPTAGSYAYLDHNADAGGLVVGDFVGNGIPGLAFWVSSGIRILLGNGDGTFSLGSILPYSDSDSGFFSRVPPVVGPFAGHGRSDVAAYRSSGVTTWVSNGDGTFQELGPFPSPPIGVANLLPGFFNNDGHLGLAISDKKRIFFMLGNGDGTFQNGYVSSVALPTGNSMTQIVAGNFDGTQNLGVAGWGKSSVGSALFVFNGNGDATLQSPLIYPVPAGSQVSPSDVNSDGFTDVIGFSPLLDELNTTIASASASSANIFIDPGGIATHNIQCSYAGDTYYSASTSNNIPEVFRQLGTPIFSLKVGKFTGPQTVSILGGTGESYYFTTDGSTPTTSSTLYTGPFVISTTTTVKAIAVQAGYLTSNVSEAVYTFAATPQFTPPPGQFSSAQTVTITDASAGSSVFYTVDGSTPTPVSTLYTSPVAVPANATLKAMAIAPNYLNSAVAAGTYSAPAQSTTTALKASATSSSISQSIMLTATVTGAAPTGSVTFTAASTTLGKANLSNGSAALNTSFAVAGTYSVTANYSGDSNNSPSTSSAVSITVTAAAPSYTVSANPTTQTITAGQSATYKITVKPANGYSAATTFTCSGLPREASCSFNPTKVTPNGSSVSTMLTITTTAPVAMLDGKPGRGLPPWAPAGSLALAGLIGVFAAPRRTRRLRALLRALSCVLLLTSAVMGASACGGGSSSGGGGQKDTGTPKGSYSVTVNASGTSSQSLNLTLVVQ